MNFRVGQKVVCVDATSHSPDHESTGLCLNAIYTVAAAVDFYGLECVRVCEVVSPHPADLFRACHFRPAVERKTDISVFTAMLDGARTPELASAEQRPLHPETLSNPEFER